MVGEAGIAGWSDDVGHFRDGGEVAARVPGRASRGERLITLVALHPDHPPAIEDRIAVGASRNAVVDLVVPEPTTLTVEVVDADGKPCADEWIGAAREIPRAEPPMRACIPWRGTSTRSICYGAGPRTDNDGRCVIEGLCPGRWTVYTNLVNEWTCVELGAGERRTVRIEKGGALSVTGRVLNPTARPTGGSRSFSRARGTASGERTRRGASPSRTSRPATTSSGSPDRRAPASTTSGPCAPGSTRRSGFSHRRAYASEPRVRPRRGRVRAHDDGGG